MSSRCIAAAAALLMFVLIGCQNDDITSPVAAQYKPPPGGGGPLEIAFMHTKKTDHCISAMAVDGSNVTSITCPGTLPADPSWEPAGTAIAYTNGVNFANLPRGLFRVNVNGTNTVQLLTYEQCPGCQSAAWSPLGDEIAVISNGYSQAVFSLLVVPAAGCPWPNSSDPCPLVLYSEPWGGADHYFSGLAWSPDGAQLAMVVSRSTGNAFIVLVDRATGAATDVYPWRGILSDWGRGGKATTLALSTAGGIYFYDLSTPQVPPQLVVANAARPSFSPDGEYIVYIEAKEPSSMVKRQLATGNRTLLLRSGAINPDWRKPGL